MKKLWAAIVGLFLVLLAMFGYERKRAENDEAKLNEAEHEKQDALLAQKQQTIDQSITDENNKLKQETKAVTQDDVSDFLKKL